MKVLDNRVFVELKKAGLETRNGLIIPEKNNGILERGTVFKAGEKCTQVEEGDTVIIQYHAGRPYTHEGTEYIIIREHDIECVIKEQ